MLPLVEHKQLLQQAHDAAAAAARLQEAEHVAQVRCLTSTCRGAVRVLPSLHS
jgi:hypothetical protein